MSVAQLRASTGFKRTPLQVGLNNDAFIGFIVFAFGDSDQAQIIADQFVAEGGIKDIHNTEDANLVAGRFIDWLIVNYWGEEDQGVTNAA